LVGLPDSLLRVCLDNSTGTGSGQSDTRAAPRLSHHFVRPKRERDGAIRCRAQRHRPRRSITPGHMVPCWWPGKTFPRLVSKRTLLIAAACSNARWSVRTRKVFCVLAIFPLYSWLTASGGSDGLLRGAR